MNIPKLLSGKYSTTRCALAAEAAPSGPLALRALDAHSEPDGSRTSPTGCAAKAACAASQIPTHVTRAHAPTTTLQYYPLLFAFSASFLSDFAAHLQKD
ncbi:MAG TPA: hypothetical protein VFS83_08860, partial [Ktedonobacterales bacterium]|nr:hypothetical protein [Ktedonobacterales bacterium]